MEALRRQDVGLDQPVNRHQRECGGADLIGKGGNAQRHAFASEPVGLAVQWLVLAVLLEQQHGEEAGAGPSARHDVKRCRWLADLLAVPAGELLTDGLDDLPLARNDFQCLGDILTQLGKAVAATGRARTGRWHNDALARQMLGERLLYRRLALEAANVGCLLGGSLGNEGVLAGVSFKLLELQLHLVEQASGTFGAGAVLLALQLGDLQLQMSDQRGRGTLTGVRVGQLGFEIVGSANGGLRLVPERQYQRLERFDVVGQGGNGGDHEAE